MTRRPVPAARLIIRERIVTIATSAEPTVCVACQHIDVLAFVVAHYPDDVALMAERGQEVLATFRKD